MKVDSVGFEWHRFRDLKYIFGLLKFTNCQRFELAIIIIQKFTNFKQIEILKSEVRFNL